MASSFARLRHEFAQCVGDAIAWRVGVKGAHEFAFRVHDVKVGTVVHDVVFRARSSLMGCPVCPVFLGDRGDLLRISVLFAVEGFVIPSYLEEWGEILLGLALVVAPWTVGYEAVSATATASSMVSGILVILFGAWELTTDRDFITWWHDRWHHPAT